MQSTRRVDLQSILCSFNVYRLPVCWPPPRLSTMQPFAGYPNVRRLTIQWRPQRLPNICISVCFVGHPDVYQVNCLLANSTAVDYVTICWSSQSLSSKSEPFSGYHDVYRLNCFLVIPTAVSLRGDRTAAATATSTYSGTPGQGDDHGVSGGHSLRPFWWKPLLVRGKEKREHHMQELCFPFWFEAVCLGGYSLFESIIQICVQ